MDALTTTEFRRISTWRRQVVRLLLATMFAALGIWGLAALVPLDSALEAVLGGALLALVVATGGLMRREKCPRCGERIRFAPRIELPPACLGCGVRFLVPEQAGKD